MTSTAFKEWLLYQPNEPFGFLLEVSREFPRSAYNDLFNQQLERLASQVGTTDLRRQIEQAAGLDWCGYIARSLRSAGFQDHDIDPLTHEVVVRLLYKPGTLFSGWNGQPILPRFKLSVKNAVINLAAKRQTQRRRIPTVSTSDDDGNTASDKLAGSHPPQGEEVIEGFRKFLWNRLGSTAVDVLDHRLHGGETKELLGRPGLETSYRLKHIVQAIKQAATEFAAGDETFLAMVRRAMADEAVTVGRRFAARVG
jgi:hypothetical protein